MNVVNNVNMSSLGHHDKMNCTKTNTQNDTKRHRQELAAICYVALI